MTLEERITALESFLDCDSNAPADDAPNDIFELIDREIRLLVQHIEAAEQRIEALESKQPC